MSDALVEAKTIAIEIDGTTYQAKEGQMLIEAADDAGIPIPRFCYHKKLSVAANCRMCLVEVDKVGKPLPACATPINDGMKVFTKSPKAISAQNATLEFLLINHPLDCPICDQGGECPLQDVSMGYGGTASRYAEEKRAVEGKDIGPLISTEMTRCIHCTLCVRFGEEVAGIREMGATGRGENVKIGTYIEQAVASEMSGNVIDLCPVGALTSKPFRFSARPWELTAHDSIAPHDCVGSNISISTLRNTVMRVLPRDNESINEIWLSDRDRFSYEAVNSAERVLTPMYKEQGEWREIDWEEALEVLVKKSTALIETHGANQLGGLISPNATLEEHYLFQKLLRGFGSQNIDHRLRQRDFSDQQEAPVYPWLGQKIAAIETCQSILLVGSNISKDQPILSQRVRKAVAKGATVFSISPIAYTYRFDVQTSLLVEPHSMALQLAAIISVLLTRNEAQAEPLEASLQSWVDAAMVNESHIEIAQSLMSADNAAVFLGGLAINHPEFSSIRLLAALIEKYSGATVGYLPEGANSTGANLVGALPYRHDDDFETNTLGLNARSMLENKLKGYFLHGIEAEYDCGDPLTALSALKGAEFVVSCSVYHSTNLQEYADLILPVVPFTENAGTLVNIEGKWQSFSAAVPPQGEAKPAWKVFRVLGNLFQLEGFSHSTSSEVLQEIETNVASRAPNNEYASNPQPKESVFSTLSDNGITRLSDVPIYAVDGTARRSQPLQDTPEGGQGIVFKLNNKTADKLGVLDKEVLSIQTQAAPIILPFELDECIADDCVYLPAAIDVSSGLGAGFEPIIINQ